MNLKVSLYIENNQKTSFTEDVTIIFGHASVFHIK